jgi:DNA-damage-inducible protein J
LNHTKEGSRHAADSIVRSRIDTATKERAAAAMEAMGLLPLRMADEKRLPFDVKVPNAKGRLAMKELAEGKGTRSASGAALFNDLGI